MPTVEVPLDTKATLASLLQTLEVNVGDDLHWAVLEIWATAEGGDLNVLSLEREVADAPHGMVMSTKALRRLATNLTQVIDGLFVGFQERKPRRTDDDLRTSALIVIEAIDSTVWRIYAREKAVLPLVLERFEDARRVPDKAIPPAHTQS